MLTISIPTRTEIAGQLDEIARLLARHPAGLGLAALNDEYAEARGERLHPRTLFRRLASLIAEERVRVEGAARATRYHAVPGSGSGAGQRGE